MLCHCHSPKPRESQGYRRQPPYWQRPLTPHQPGGARVVNEGSRDTSTFFESHSMPTLMYSFSGFAVKSLISSQTSVLIK